jgi:hypothetical protein
MFFAESKYTNNVYYIDLEDSSIELWDFQNEKMRWRQKRGPAELAEELYNMLANGWVKRTSKELEAAE